MSVNSDNQNGVYYRREDYASLLRRCLAVAVDSISLIVLSLFIAWIWSFFARSPDFDLAIQYGWLSMAFTDPLYFWCCLLVSYVYLALLKATHLRTIGYRLTDLKVVDLRGLRPSIWQMTWRFILLVFGPIDLIVDLVWLGGDDNRQTLRDKLAETYVIRLNATPTGTGTLVYQRYFFMGWSVLFREIKRTSIKQQNPIA